MISEANQFFTKNASLSAHTMYLINDVSILL